MFLRENDPGSANGSVTAADAPGDPDALQRWCSSAEVLVGFDWGDVDGGAHLELVGALQRATRVAEAALASGLAALDRVGAAERASGLTAGAWLAHSSRACGGQAAWLARAGLLMERFASLGAAVRRGELGLDHLRVLDQVGDPLVLERLAGHDAELSAAALRFGMAAWRREVRARVGILRDELDRERRAAAAAAAAAAASRADAGDEAVDSRGDDPPGESTAGTEPAGGAMGAGAAGQESEQDPDHGATDGNPAPTPSGGLFDAADRCGEGAADTYSDDDRSWLSVRPTAGGGISIHGELFGVPAESLRQALQFEASHQRRLAWREHDECGVPMPSAGQLRARALVELVRRGLGTEIGSSVAPRTDAVVVIHADDDLAARVRALDGEPLPPEVAGLLTCDAHLQALVVDRKGQPLWLGRSVRLASPAQRRVLAIRDGGCVFPGCDMPSEWCDVHHQPAWESGGRTDVDAMALLCRRHHGAAHTRRWSLRPATSDDPGPPAPGPPRAAPAATEVPRAGPPVGQKVTGKPDGGPLGDFRSKATPSEASGSARGCPDAGGQHFEWLDQQTGRTVPARQRGLKWVRSRNGSLTANRLEG